MVTVGSSPYIYNKVYRCRQTICLLCFLFAIITVKTTAAPFVPTEKHTLTKQQQKTCRDAVKRLKAEGYETLTKTLDIAAVVERHYAAMAARGTAAVMIESLGSGQTVDAASRQAVTKALAQIARMYQSEVAATVLTEIETTEEDSRVHLSQSTQASTEKTIRRREPSAEFVRRTKDGRYETLLWYIVDTEI